MAYRRPIDAPEKPRRSRDGSWHMAVPGRSDVMVQEEIRLEVIWRYIAIFLSAPITDSKRGTSQDSGNHSIDAIYYTIPPDVSNRFK